MNKGLRPAEEPRARGFRPPMVYVYENTKWEYKKLSRDLAHEGLPTEEEMNALGAEDWDRCTPAEAASEIADEVTAA